MRHVWVLIVPALLAATLALAPAATARAADAPTAVAEQAAPAEGHQPAAEAQPAAQPAPAAQEQKPAAEPAPAAQERKTAEQPQPAAESPKPAETPKEAPPKHVGPEGIKWAAGLDQALQAAKAEEKPLFIMFRADWCSYCRMLETKSLPDAKVKEELAKFVNVQVDIDTEKDTVKRFEVVDPPVLIVTDSTGKVLAKVVGFRPPDVLLDLLAYGGAALRAAKNPADAEAAFTLAVKSPGIEEDISKRLELAKKALELMAEGEKSKRGAVLLVRGDAVASAEPPDFAAAVKDVEEAKSLDPNNETGVREDADWLGIKVHFLQSKDKDQPAKIDQLGKDVEKFLADYPVDKVKKPRLRYQALWTKFQIQATKQDFAGAVATLEQFKAENKELLPPQEQQINMIIEQLKSRQAAQQPPPAPKPEEQAPKVEPPAPKSGEPAPPKTDEPAPKVEPPAPKTGEPPAPPKTEEPKGQAGQPAPAATKK